MADFCRQCTIEYFGEENADKNDCKGLQEAELDETHEIAVLCEGCGITGVNSKGECNGNCYKGHNNTPIRQDEE